MRTRTRTLLTGYLLVLLALGHRGVWAQKYYMNFAFNNNNPEPKPGGGRMYERHGSFGNPREAEGTPSAGGDDAPVDEHVGATEHVEHGPGAPGEGPGDGDKGEQKPGGGEGAGKLPPGGKDDDNDDSDSHDDKDRREKLEAEEEGKGKGREHSHHSSYEISIDDSFGGRYVRSIYESSESHGHSGSRADSNRQDSKMKRESSEEKEKESGKDQETTTGGPVVGNVVDAVIPNKDQDYEEAL